MHVDGDSRTRERQWYTARVLAQRDVWPDRIRPLRRAEYDSLVARGLLDDTRVELLHGTLVEMSPQGPLHADIVSRLFERLVRLLPGHVRTRAHSPLALSDDSEPEPDIAVVTSDDYRHAHPQQALLVIEVADSSLRKDRGVKAALYATAGVAELWVVDLNDRSVEVYREPIDGFYASIVRVDMNGSLIPSAFPAIAIPVAELLG